MYIILYSIKQLVSIPGIPVDQSLVFDNKYSSGDSMLIIADH